MKKIIKVSPSLLSADFARLADDIARVEAGGCDYLHVDVMDGHFVPNITIGPCVVKSIKKVSQVPLDVHLMIDAPWKYIEDFAKNGSDHITVHQEACGDRLGEVLDQIRSYGKTTGVSLKPGTSESTLKDYLSRIDMVLIMTVEPGFGGQSFMRDMLPKITRLRNEYKGLIEVDGGINRDTAKETISAGADVLVAGTAVFGHSDPALAVKELKEL